MRDNNTRRRKGWLRLLLVLFLSGFAVLNSIAWMQAWAMTHYASGGPRTAKAETLSLFEKVRAIFTGVSVTRPVNDHTPADVGLDYETRTIGMEGDYLEAWFVPHAASRGLVLMFPGYAESKTSLLPSASILHSLGYNLLMVDFRGAGGSSGSETTLGVREAKDVARSVDYARAKWPAQPVVLYGVSMGTTAVMRGIALEGVQVDALILESPFDRLLSTVRNRFHSMGLPATPGSELLLFWGSVQQGFNGFEHNPVEYATAIQCPTLVLHGKEDPRVTTDEVRSVYSHLPGTRQLMLVGGAGHESLAVYAPQAWKDKVEHFLHAHVSK
ncbi:MAG: alpha/beta fold hydrolase [Chloroflexota bacterium]|nr:alpha/beta fold hydrolase [Chloroflexota bacterium]